MRYDALYEWNKLLRYKGVPSSSALTPGGFFNCLASFKAAPESFLTGQESSAGCPCIVRIRDNRKPVYACEAGVAGSTSPAVPTTLILDPRGEGAVPVDEDRQCSHADEV